MAPEVLLPPQRRACSGVLSAAVCGIHSVVLGAGRVAKNPVAAPCVLVYVALLFGTSSYTVTANPVEMFFLRSGGLA